MDKENHRYKALAVHLIVAALVTMAFTTATLAAANASDQRIIEDRGALAATPVP